MDKQHKYRSEIQNRGIAPSEDSWNQLSEKLDAYENNGKGKYGMFLKYAAVILVLVSVGFYFFNPTKKVTNTPIIVAPILKEDVKVIPVPEGESPIEVAEAVEEIPANTSKGKKENQLVKDRVAIKTKKTSKEIEKEDIRSTLVNEEMTVTKLDEVPENIETIDDEIDQLLKNALLKQTGVSKKRVNSYDLLADVEDDINKDLKQKLFDKITKTLKKPKQIITDNGN